MDQPNPNIQLNMRSINSVTISGVVVTPVTIDEHGRGYFTLRTGISEKADGRWTTINVDQAIFIPQPKTAERQRSGLVLGKLITIQGRVGGGVVSAEHIEWNGMHASARAESGSGDNASWSGW